MYVCSYASPFSWERELSESLHFESGFLYSVMLGRHYSTERNETVSSHYFTERSQCTTGMQSNLVRLITLVSGRDTCF